MATATGICPSCGVPYDDAHRLPAPGAQYQIPLCLPDQRRMLKDWKKP